MRYKIIAGILIGLEALTFCSCAVKREKKIADYSQLEHVSIDSSRHITQNNIDFLDSVELHIVTTEFYKSDSLSPPIKSIQEINLKRKSHYDNSTIETNEVKNIETTSTHTFKQESKETKSSNNWHKIGRAHV